MKVPEIPKSEYPERVEKVRRLMRKHDADAVFVYHDELHMADGCYLTNYWPTIEAGGVLVPARGEPIFLGGPEAQAYAREVSAVADLRAVDVFVVPEEEYPGAVIESLSDVLKEAAGGKKLRRLGMAGFDAMPYTMVEDWRKALPDIEFVDITRDYVIMRAIKSEAEIAMMGRAFDAGAEGIKAALPVIKAGATEYQVVAAAEGRMRALGIDGFNFRGICASGPRSNGVVPPASGKELAPGELLLLSTSPRHRGYASGVGFTCPVDNPPTKDQARFVGHLAEAMRVTRDALRPGMTGREIDTVPRKFLSDLGYGPYLSMGMVHTVGLNEFERPFFGPNSDEVIEPNITVCLDISMFGHPAFYGSRVEAGYVVRESGAEPLSVELERLILSLREPDGLWSQFRA